MKPRTYGRGSDTVLPSQGYDEYGAMLVWWLGGRGNWRNWRNPTPVPIRPPRISPRTETEPWKTRASLPKPPWWIFKATLVVTMRRPQVGRELHIKRRNKKQRRRVSGRWNSQRACCSGFTLIGMRPRSGLLASRRCSPFQSSQILQKHVILCNYK